MPRFPMDMTDSGQKAAYHVINRTAFDGLSFEKIDMSELGRIIQTFLPAV